MAWPVKDDVALAVFERGAGGDADLLLDEVEAGQHLGHRMLDLEPGVHLDEVELAVLVEELDGADALISELGAWLPRPARRSACALRRVEGRGMRLLPHLLMPALQRAVALAEMHRAALAVAEHLDLDMARRSEVLLDIDLVIAEGGLGFGLRGLQCGFESASGVRATFMPRPPPPAVALISTG